MGSGSANADIPVIKGTSGILALTDQDVYISLKAAPVSVVPNVLTPVRFSCCLHLLPRLQSMNFLKRQKSCMPWIVLSAAVVHIFVLQKYL
jgi:Na+-translocating ferredoxin:NAD+ oxidoreductase RnfC subunit